MAKPVSDYIMYLVELLGCVGAVKVKSMFGGYGVALNRFRLGTERFHCYKAFFRVKDTGFVTTLLK